MSVHCVRALSAHLSVHLSVHCVPAPVRAPCPPRYVGEQLVGEPLSPEEVAHAALLEGDKAHPPWGGAAGPYYRVLPAGIVHALIEKRQRRAVSRAEGLEAALRLLHAAPSRASRAELLTALARAFRRFGSDGPSRGSLFFGGCSGCGEPVWSRLRVSLVGVLSLLGEWLRAARDGEIHVDLESEQPYEVAQPHH